MDCDFLQKTKGHWSYLHCSYIYSDHWNNGLVLPGCPVNHWGRLVHSRKLPEGQQGGVLPSSPSAISFPILILCLFISPWRDITLYCCVKETNFCTSLSCNMKTLPISFWLVNSKQTQRNLILNFTLKVS